jgi:hypothetical protein
MAYLIGVSPLWKLGRPGAFRYRDTVPDPGTGARTGPREATPGPEGPAGRGPADPAAALLEQQTPLGGGFAVFTTRNLGGVALFLLLVPSLEHWVDGHVLAGR